MRGVGELLAAPNHCSGLLVQRDHCSFRAPGGHQYLFSINHRRFGIPPIRANSTEILHQIFPPALLAGRRFHADKIAPLTKLKNELALHGWRAARTFKLRVADWARLPQFSRPELLALGGIQRDHKARSE